MTQTLLNMIQLKGYFLKHRKVLVAVSGGADSMGLLTFLEANQEALGIHIGVAHMNHKQRPESELEEAYLNEWTKSHQIPFYVRHFTGQFSEKAARDSRYAFFADVMEQDGYTALVTAHHADDQAETVLMRLIRGSRLRHLAAMSEVAAFGKGELIRPFLSLSKKSLPKTVHFEDSSNTSMAYLRNRTRLEYLPLLSQENPRFGDHLLDLAQEVRQLQTAFKSLTANLVVTDLKTFRQQEPSVQYFLLQNYLDTFPDLALSKGQFDQLLSQLQKPSPKQMPLKNGYVLNKRYDTFDILKQEIEPQPLSQVITLNQEITFGDYHLRFVKKSGETSSQEISIWSEAPILLRHRKPGDTIDFGSHRKKLRRLFIDAKIPAEDRAKALVAEQNGQIIFTLVGNRIYLKKAPENAILYGTIVVTAEFFRNTL